MAAFAAWQRRFLAATPEQRLGMIAEGLVLAQARRATLERWIQEDPARALAAAVPESVRRSLPAAVVAALEERIAGAGELSLMAVTPAPGAALPARATYRKALINGREFYAYTYGRREALNSLPQASLHGIAIGDALAISDSPVRVLETGETAGQRAAVAIDSATGAIVPVPPDQPLNLDPAAPTAIEFNGRIEVMSSAEEVLQREILAAHQEERDAGYDDLHGHEVVAGNNLPGSSGVAHRPSQAWTHGTKKVLMIRIDFSDMPGVPLNISQGSVPITETYAVDRINSPDGVRDFFEQNSYGKTSLSIADAVSDDSPDVTDVLRVPQSASYYATGNFTAQLHSDARAAAATAGFAVDSYDRVGVVFSNLGSLPGTQVTWGGLAVVQGKNFWINGNYTFSVVAHEIGHNYGLPHANLWQVSDGDPVSPGGTSLDYGDIYDVMGGGYGMENHFSHWNKSLLQWIPDTGVTTIASGGTYRVYRFDHSGANLANALALKIVRNRDEDYWIGLRRATDNASLDGGAYVLWGYNDSRESNLLDLTAPVNDLASAALAVGATFTDTVAGITLNPVAQGGSGADEWLDVQVTLLPRLSWAQSEFIVDEQGGTATLTLNRDSNSTGSVGVSYATSNGSATAPADYTTTSGTVAWADGDMAPKTITIPITADALVEGAENFTVTLSGPTGGAVIVNSAAATVTVADPGARDTSFTPAFVNSAVEKFIPLPDGGALMSGWFNTGIVRLKEDGSVDSTFLQDGGFGAFDGWKRVADMARQPDGKIIVGGEFTTFNGQACNRIARLNADGSLDASFNAGTGANDTVNSLLLQPDGKIIVGGTFTTFNGANIRMLTRLNADGSVDSSFTAPEFGGGANWRVESLALQPDGKILAGGTFYFATGNFQLGLCRVTTSGALDSSFDSGNGAHGSSNVDARSVLDIAVEMDGRILVAGTFSNFDNNPRGGVARLSSTGAVDGGLAPTSDGSCNALLVQPDGRILLAGSFTTFNGESASRLVRLSSSGVVESGFAAAGGADKDVSALALQADGKVLLGGQVSMTFQGSSSTSSFWRFFGGLPGLPGVVELGAETVAGIEGASATLSVTRTGGSSGVLSVGYSTVAGTAGSSDFTTTAGTLTWNDGDTAAKTILVPVSADGLAEAAESFTVNLGQPLRNSTQLGAVQRATVNVATAFDSWRGAYFTPLELADSGVSGDLADPDGDGLSNLLEFALSLSPRSNSSSSGVPASAVQNVGGTDYLTLTFKRRAPALDLTYTVQTNDGTLAAPGWLSNAVQVGTAVDHGDGTETVTFRDAAAVSSSTRRFMRVQITRAP